MIRIQKNSAIVFFLLLFSMNWTINDYMGNNMTRIVENGFRIFAALCSAFLYLKNRKDSMKISLPFLLLILMQGWLILSTAIQQGDLKTSILGLFPLLVIGLLFESMLGSPESVICGGMLLGEVLIYANFLAVLLFPNGMYSTYLQEGVWYTTENWLFGNKNLFFPYLLFGCVIAYIYSSHGGKKWREWGVYLASFLSVFLTGSGTSIVAMILLMILFLFLKTKRVQFHVYLLTGINIALFFLIVVFRAQNVFSFLIEDVLGKSLTFSGRTRLWDILWTLIGKNPIFGFGIMESGVPQKLTGISFGQMAHNLIIDHLYKGGIVYLGLYLVVMILVYRKLRKYQNTNVGQCIIVALFVFQITGLVEAHNGFKSIFIYMIYFIAYNVDRFIPQKEIEETSPKQRRIRIALSD